MSQSLLAELKVQLEEASAGLPGVTQRKMFGCEAFFGAGSIYALVWSDGRIGLKLRDPARFAELMAMPGAERWSPGRSAMSHWVLVPEGFHDDAEQLLEWTLRAHADALTAPARKAAQVQKKKPGAPKKMPARKAMR